MYNTTLACFLLFNMTSEFQSKWQVALILSLSNLHPIKSETVYPTKLQFSPFGSYKPNYCMPLRYFIIPLSVLRCDSFGMLENEHKDTHQTWYKDEIHKVTWEPIITQYFHSLTCFTFSSLSRLHKVSIRVTIILDFSMLNLFSRSFKYLDLLMKVPSLVWWIWSPGKYWSSPIIDILNSFCIILEKSLHKNSLAAPNMIP